MVSHTDSFSDETSNGSSNGGAIVPSGENRWPTEALSRPEILTVHPRPVDLLNALRRRWLWAIGLGILSTVLAVLAAMLLIPENYRATAWLRIADRAPNIIFEDKGRGGFLDERRAQATLMTSNFVLTAALRREGVAQLPYIQEELDPITWLKGNVQVSFPGNSEILQVAMVGDDRHQLKILVDAVKDAYMNEVVAVDRGSHLRRKTALEASYHRYVEEIKRKTYEYKRLANQLMIAGSPLAEQRALHQLEGLKELRQRTNRQKQTISGMKQHIALLTARKESLHESNQTPDMDTVIRQIIDEHLMRDPIIARSYKIVAAMEQSIFQMSLQSRLKGRELPAVKKLKERIDLYKDAIAKRRALLFPNIQKQAIQHLERGYRPPPSKADQIDELIAMKQLELGVAEKEMDETYTQFKAAAKEAEKLGTASAELEEKKVNLERLKRLTYRMGDELERREIELAADARVTVLEHATVPKTSDIKQKHQKVAFIGLAAFALAVLGVAAIDFLSRRISSTNEVAYGLGVQVIGDLPMLSGRLWRHRSTLNGAASRPLHGMLIESIDNIRTALLHRAHSESLRTVLVTSALEQEGKTTLSSQLSASLARSGRRTLLVDGDLRRPSSHRLFELPVEPGISEVLRGEVDLDQIIRPTRVPGLWLASAGTCDLDAIQALAKGDFRQSFEQLRDEFDFVIIDSGPVLTDADALLFGQYTDGVILSVLRDVSRVPRVFEAVQRLKAVDLRLLGAVVNGVSFGKYRSYYRPYTVQVDAAPTPAP